MGTLWILFELNTAPLCRRPSLDSPGPCCLISKLCTFHFRFAPPGLHTQLRNVVLGQNFLRHSGGWVCRLGFFLPRLLEKLRSCEVCGGLRGSSEAEPLRVLRRVRGYLKGTHELALMGLGEVRVAVREHEHSLLHSAARCDLLAGCPSLSTGADRATVSAGLSGASSQGSAGPAAGGPAAAGPCVCRSCWSVWSCCWRLNW